MKHSLPPLDTLKAFESAARLLSFSQAADELCVSKGAISYHIKKLEAHIGQALFKRTTRQVLLTDNGQVLLQQTQHWFAQLNSQITQLQQDAAALVIEITTYTAVRWLSPKIAAYRQSYPNQPITLQHNVKQAPNPKTQADVSVLWQHQHQPADFFIAAPLFPVASPKLMQTITPTSLSAGQLNQTPWSQVDLLTETPQDPLWQAWNNGQAPNNAQILIEDANVRVQAAIDGQGLILADLLMQAELDTDVLVRISNHHLTGVGYGIKANSLAGQKLVAWLQEQAST